MQTVAHTPPAIVWFRHDLRLGDNPALSAAAASGRPIAAIFIRDASVDAMGACPKWRLGLSLRSLMRDLRKNGINLILRSGDARKVIPELVAEIGAGAVFWNRSYAPQEIARDSAVKSILKSGDITCESSNGGLLIEPWQVQTKTGGFFKVYTPFWKAIRGRDIAAPCSAPDLRPQSQAGQDPHSEDIDSWDLGKAMHRGAEIVAQYQCVGETAAQARLMHFLDERVDAYGTARDRMDIDATSRLSENLTYGEMSPRQIWHAARARMIDGASGAEKFLKELAWREFAIHLMFHTPHILNQNWRDGWDAFPWRGDTHDAEKWRRGETGEPIIDAAMREMYVTGQMHNRARMVVASYLTKHLMTDWRIGQAWFAECLADWDPAANAMGWQWVAGCGPDAAPFFRIFNPATQAEKFDPDGRYRQKFLGDPNQNPEARAFLDAAPRHWNAARPRDNVAPIVGLAEGRARALAAYKHVSNAKADGANQNAGSNVS